MIASDVGDFREHLLSVNLPAKLQGKGRYSFLLLFADKVTLTGGGHLTCPKLPSE